MTFSIVGRSTDGSCLGVAVASKVLAVGRAVPGAEADVGAVATQATCNLMIRPRALRMMREGLSPEEIAEKLVDGDADGSRRQFGIVDRNGISASYTGVDCIPWAGGRSGPNYAIQGNLLVGPEVIEAMEVAWLESSPDHPLEWNLLAALMAGDRSGGDRRGRQSAAVFVVSPEGAHEAGRGGGSGGPNDEAVNLRVDDHFDPVLELCRLLNLKDACGGSRSPDPPVVLDGALAREIAPLLRRVGYGPQSYMVEDVSGALERWAIEENLDERLAGGAVDVVVLEHLRRRAGDSWVAPLR